MKFKFILFIFIIFTFKFNCFSFKNLINKGEKNFEKLIKKGEELEFKNFIFKKFEKNSEIKMVLVFCSISFIKGFISYINYEKKIIRGKRDLYERYLDKNIKINYEKVFIDGFFNLMTEDKSCSFYINIFNDGNQFLFYKVKNLFEKVKDLIFSTKIMYNEKKYFDSCVLSRGMIFNKEKKIEYVKNLAELIIFSAFNVFFKNIFEGIIFKLFDEKGKKYNLNKIFIQYALNTLFSFLYELYENKVLLKRDYSVYCNKKTEINTGEKTEINICEKTEINTIYKDLYKEYLSSLRSFFSLNFYFYDLSRDIDFYNLVKLKIILKK